MTVEITSPSIPQSRFAPVVGPAPPGKQNDGEKGQVRDRDAVVRGESPAESSQSPVSRTSLTQQPEEKDAQQKELLQAVAQIKEFVQSVKRNLEFSVDSESGREVIKVIDAETDKVIRQIPPEDVLKIARHFHENMGSLIRVEA